MKKKTIGLHRTIEWTLGLRHRIQNIDVGKTSAREHRCFDNIELRWQPYITYFLNITRSRIFPVIMWYPSIHPGKKPSGPVVFDLRWLKYQPTGIIQFKSNYILTTISKIFPTVQHQESFDKLGTFRPCKNKNCPIPIPKGQWDDLQSLNHYIDEAAFLPISHN